MIKDETVSNISQLNAIELLTTREANEIDLEGTNSQQDDLSIFENMEIFKDFRYAYFVSNFQFYKRFIKNKMRKSDSTEQEIFNILNLENTGQKLKQMNMKFLHFKQDFQNYSCNIHNYQ